MSKLDGWAIVEVMGHSKYAGKVSEHTVGAAAFIRVDVPEIPAVLDGERVVRESAPGFTKFLGVGSIFAITPVTEEVARAAVAGWRSEPVSLYGLGLRRQQPALVASDDDDECSEAPMFD